MANASANYAKTGISSCKLSKRVLSLLISPGRFRLQMGGGPVVGCRQPDGPRPRDVREAEGPLGKTQASAADRHCGIRDAVSNSACRMAKGSCPFFQARGFARHCSTPHFGGYQDANFGGQRDAGCAAREIMVRNRALSPYDVPASAPRVHTELAPMDILSIRN